MASQTQTTCGGMVKYLDNLEGYAGRTADPALVFQRKSGDILNQILGLKDATLCCSVPSDLLTLCAARCEAVRIKAA